MKQVLESIEILKKNGVDILKSEVLGIYFTRLEFNIFFALLINNRIMNDIEIKRMVGLSEYSEDYHVVKIAINRFRRKIEAKTKVNPFITYRSKGYIINGEFIKVLNKVSRKALPRYLLISESCT